MEVGEQQVARLIGLVHLRVAAAAIRVNSGKQPAVCRLDIFRIGGRRQAQEAAGLSKLSLVR